MRTHSNIRMPTRIVLYYILAIVIPSILMGALAYRGVKNDQALVERENRRQALERGNQIIEFIQGVMTNLEEDFTRVTLNHPVPQKVFFSDTMLEDFVLQHPIVHGVFFIDGNTLRTLGTTLQYLPNNEGRSKMKLDATASRQLQAGWKYEYQNQDVVKALTFYQDLMPDLPDGYSRAIALNSIARLQKKANALESAVKSYEILSRDYGDYRINNSLPLGLVADAELTKLHVDKGDVDGAFQVQLRLQENLINRKWQLDEVSYSLFATMSSEFLHDQKLNPGATPGTLLPRLDSLMQRRLSLQFQTRSFLSFREKVLDKVVPKLKNTELNTSDRWIEESEGSVCLTSIVPDGNQGYWCMLTIADSLLNYYVKPLLAKSSADGRWHWSLLDDTREVLVYSDEIIEESDFVEMIFPAKLPGWTLLAYTKPLSLLQTFLGSGQGVYFYMFLFIGAVLIVGLLFVLYSVNREMHLTIMKSEFVATVSHEFKSPLTAIRQITEMLQKDRVPKGKREKYYSVLLQQGARLTHLIDNILDFSRMEQGKKSYAFREIDIGELIRELVDRYQKRVEDKGYKLHLTVPARLPKLQADADAIEQVLHNLLDNAVKYSGNSRNIDIQSEVHNSTIVTSVRDYGIGIPEEEQAKIFEQFYRAGNAKTHDIKGSGIGLTLVKEIVEAHGGGTGVDSSVGEGSTFYFYLPVLKNKLYEENIDH